MRALRQRFWFCVMDACAATTRAVTKVYMFAVVKASDATDWGEPEELSSWDDDDTHGSALS